MTDNKSDFFKRLQNGEQSAWQSFMAVMEPMLIGKMKRIVRDLDMSEAKKDEYAQDIAHDIFLGFVANLPKIAIDPAPPPESDKS